MLNKIYLGFGSLMLLGYSVIAFTGWEPGSEPRQFVPAGVHAHGSHGGGYRSFYFWSWGFHGGK